MGILNNNMKLRYQWGLFILMLPLVHYTPLLALHSGSGAGLCYQIFTQPLAHANILHWAINLFSWMLLWRYVSAWRLLVAYLCACYVGWFWSILPYDGGLSLCGFSGIIFWFLGMLVPVRGIPYLVAILPTLVIPFFFPQIAASVHLICFVMGWFYSLIILQK